MLCAHQMGPGACSLPPRLHEASARQRFNCRRGLGRIEPPGVSFSAKNAEIATIKFPLQPHPSVSCVRALSLKKCSLTANDIKKVV